MEFNYEKGIKAPDERKFYPLNSYSIAKKIFFEMEPEFSIIFEKSLGQKILKNLRLLNYRSKSSFVFRGKIEGTINFRIWRIK